MWLAPHYIQRLHTAVQPASKTAPARDDDSALEDTHRPGPAPTEIQQREEPEDPRAAAYFVQLLRTAVGTKCTALVLQVDQSEDSLHYTELCGILDTQKAMLAIVKSLLEQCGKEVVQHSLSELPTMIEQLIAQHFSATLQSLLKQQKVVGK